jgi:hypothetical protein
LLVGPFKSIENINVPVAESDSTGDWYVIGDVDYISSSYVFSLFSLDLEIERFIVSSYTITVEPQNTDIYADQGVIISFDNVLRPQYLDLTLDPVVVRG